MDKASTRTGTKRDMRKYKVIHIPTNTESHYSSKLAAVTHARGIDGMVLQRDAEALRYEFLCEYRWGKRK